MSIVILILMFTIPAFSPGTGEATIFRQEAIMPYEKLWRAICKVESNNNPLAYNPHEGAVGIAQVRLCRIKDYNRLTRQNMPLKAMYDPLKAKEVFMYFAGQFSPDDILGICRSWNGQSRMNKYYKKVKLLI